MANFIKLDGQRYINIDIITHIDRNTDGSCAIYFNNNSFIHYESYIDITQRIMTLQYGGEK